MIHISIEGMDGVGKSTISKLVAEKLGYKFVEKPLHYLFDKNEDSLEEYMRISHIVNENPNRIFTSWFYGLGSIYMYELFREQNIVTDRHLASNFAWSGAANNAEVYDLLISKIGVPKLTIILYCPSEVLVERIKERDPNDADIAKVKKSEIIYSRMISFCQQHNMPYFVLDSSKLKPEETVAKVLNKINEND